MTDNIKKSKQILSDRFAELNRLFDRKGGSDPLSLESEQTQRIKTAAFNEELEQIVAAYKLLESLEGAYQ